MIFLVLRGGNQSIDIGQIEPSHYERGAGGICEGFFVFIPSRYALG